MIQRIRIAFALAGSAALPAFAHVTASATPHWHDGDGWGVLAVCALTAVAAWLDRRRR
jgi:hypothetical protein